MDIFKIPFTADIQFSITEKLINEIICAKTRKIPFLSNITFECKEKIELL